MKWIEGFEGLYMIEPSGRVYSYRAHRYLKQKIDRYGYAVVALTKDGKAHHITVHRLVAQAYVPNPYGKPCVNHINEDKTDNNAKNLEWVTIAENDNHGTRNQRMAQSKSRKPVECISADGTITRFAGVKDASRKTGIAHSLIRGYCRGKHSIKYNMTWRYANESH